MEDILIGTADRTILVEILDSASTTGQGKTGLAHTAITVSYTRVETDNDVVNTDVTSSLNALTNLTDAHNDWGWKEVSSTLAPGLYRLDVADAVFATGAWYAVLSVMVTTGTASVTPKAFRLVSRNDLDGVRLGLTALPNAAADAAGGLPISDAGGLDLDNRMPSSTAVTNLNTVFATDYATVYDATNKAFLAKLGNFAMGGSSLALTTGAISGTTLTTSGTVTLNALTVTNATTLSGAVSLGSTLGITGAITATNASNNLTLGTFTVTTNAIPWNAAWDAEVQSEVDDALVAQRLDELLNADSDIDGAAPPTVGSVFHELMTKTAGSFTFDQTTDSLEALRDRGDSAWTTATGFSTLTQAQVTGGAYALDTDANGRIRIVDGTGAGEINTNAGAIALVDLVTDITTKTGYRLSATGVDDVWDEPLAAHTTADTPGSVLNMLTQDSVTLSTDVALGSIIGQLLDAGTSWTYDRTTDSLEANRDNIGTAGAGLTAADDAVISAIGALNNITAASVWAVATRTLTSLSGLTVDTVTTLTNLPAITSNWLTAVGLATDAAQEIRNAITGGAYALDTDANGRIRVVDGTAAGEIDTSSGAVAHVILADTITTYTGDTPQTGDSFARIGATGSGLTTLATAASITALNDLSASEVNAEVVDALATDTYAEPGQGTPAATATLAAKINYLYKAWRNRKTQTAAAFKLYADDATTVDQKATVSDDATTYDFGELVTGP